MRSQGMGLARAAIVLALVAGCRKEPVAKQIAWRDLGAGEAEAYRSGKPTLVMFSAQWSVASKDLETKSMVDPAVRAVSERFVPIRVDATDDEEPSLRPVLERFRVVGLPTLLVVSSGVVVYRAHHAVPPRELVKELENAADHHEAAMGAIRLRMAAARAVPHAPVTEPATDLDAAKTIARTQKKPLLVILGWTWTAASMHLEHTTLSDPLIRDILDKSYVVVRLESERAPTEYRSAIAPAALLLTPSGYERSRVDDKVSVEALAIMLEHHAAEPQ